MTNGLRNILTAGLLLILPGCGHFETVESGEHAVKFAALPTYLPGTFSGGIGEKVIGPGEMVFVFPWEKLYRIDTSIQSVGWGGVGYGTSPQSEDYLETRALDGNEVGLSMTVQYSIDPKRVEHVVQRVGADDESVRRLVSTVARADIQTHMNTLRTPDFFNPELRQAAVNKVREALAHRLAPEGIVIEDVVYYDHRFERRLADGSVDRTYQEQIDSTQKTNQETEQELKKIITVVEQKKQEYNDVQAKVNRMVEEGQGYKTQAMLRGDSYLEAKKNEADTVFATGMAEVEGLKKQVAALSGAGGKALLRLSIARALLAKDPKFVVVNSGGNDRGVDINRVDTNELLRQAGLFAAGAEAVKEKTAAETPAAAPKKSVMP